MVHLGSSLIFSFSWIMSTLFVIGHRSLQGMFVPVTKGVENMFSFFSVIIFCVDIIYNCESDTILL